MGIAYSPSIITNGLVVCIDAANIKSYNGSGTKWNDLTINANNATLVNSPTFTSEKGGAFSFDGINDHATIDSFSYIPYCLDFWVYNNTQITANDTNMGGPSNYQTLFRNTSGLDLNMGGWAGSMVNETLHIENENKYTYLNQTIPVGYHNWVYNWNGSNYDIWVDGVKRNAIASTAGHATLVNQSGLNYIGFNANSYYFFGKIFIIKIYGAQINDDAVLQNFRAARGRFGI